MLKQQQAIIEVQHLVKRYPKAKTNAVDDLSFSVAEGEIFGLLGPNGVGKTTTIGILTTSVIPIAGTARVGGIDVCANPVEVKRQIAVVPQINNLDRSLKAREILLFHARYHLLPRAVREGRADQLLREFGLEKNGKDDVSRYSGGMAQRLMLARALMHVPRVLFLDEPTNNLDPQARHFLWERILAFKKRGVTVLLTTHDMEEADQLCDRIAIMDHGKMLVLDTPTELKKLVPDATRLELQVSVPELVAAGSSMELPTASGVLPMLSRLQEDTKVEEIGTPSRGQGERLIHTYQMYTRDPQALTVGVTRAVVEAGMELQDVHIIKPSLEDVFIYLTGRKLRS